MLFFILLYFWGGVLCKPVPPNSTEDIGKYIYWTLLMVVIKHAAQASEKGKNCKDSEHGLMGFFKKSETEETP